MNNIEDSQRLSCNSMSEGMNNEVEKGLHSYTTKCAILGELFGQSLQGIY